MTDVEAPTEPMVLAALALVKSDLFRSARVGDRVSLHYEATKHNDTQGTDNSLFIRVGEEPAGERLLHVAAAAATEDFTPVGVTIRDHSGSRLGEEAEEAAEAVIVQALRRRDVNTAVAVLHGERGPLEVLAVQFFTGTGDGITLYAEAVARD